jgi:hypothetical protein
MLNFYEYLKRGGPAHVLLEMTDEIVDELTNWLEEHPDAIGFNNIFGSHQRILVPFLSPEMKELKNKIEAIPNKGFKVDLTTGMVSTPVQTQRGTATRQIRIGKVIQQFLGPEEQKVWATAGGGYLVVLSRAPIDVVRMSDFENIQSCHSQGGMYFKCAVSEAKGNGPIAYLVNTNDIKKVDLDSEEIFEDPQRGIKGIQPVARIRVRKFVPKKNAEDDSTGALAIPEEPVYGISYTGSLAESLRESVRDFLFEKQQEILGGKRPNMKDYERVGGSYVNAGQVSSNWWNDFFGDNEDKGDAKYRQGEEEESREKQYQAEIDEIKRIHEGALTSGHVWCDASVEESDGHIYVSVTGGVSVDINESMFKKDVSESWKLREVISEKLSGKPLHLWGVDDVNIDYRNGIASVQIYLRDDGQGVPEDLEEMYSLCENYDKKYNQVQNAVYSVLHDLGYVEDPYHYKWTEGQHNWRHFKLSDEDEDYMQVYTTVPLGVSINDKAGYWLNPQGGLKLSIDETKKKHFQDILANLWVKEIKRAQYSLKKGWLPKIEPDFLVTATGGRERRPDEFPLPHVELYVGHINYNEPDQFIANISFDFLNSLEHGKAQMMEKLIDILDNRWNTIVPVMKQLLNNIFSTKSTSFKKPPYSA